MARRDLTKKTKPQLKKILWEYFSKYIRARDNYTCYTCGKPGNQAGHYIPRSQGSATYYHEMNVKCQCYHCNINLSGNSFIFREKLVREYGEPEVLALEQLGKTIKKLEKPELIELIEKYKGLSGSS